MVELFITQTYLWMQCAASFEGCKMIMLKTNLYMSVQIMDNIKYSDDLFIDGHYQKINGLRCSVPKINGHENIDLPTSVI